MAEKQPTKTIAVNRQARHEYFIEESFETGIELTGTEVKSLRSGSVNLKDSWVDVGTGELIVKQMHISPYEKGNIFNKDPMRPRRLLMHRGDKPLLRIGAAAEPDPYSAVLYFKGSLVKMQLGLCKGKKLFDKREDQAKRTAMRDIDRAIKERNH
jgi:SsrA-binding protein